MDTHARNQIWQEQESVVSVREITYIPSCSCDVREKDNYVCIYRLHLVLHIRIHTISLNTYIQTEERYYSDIRSACVTERPLIVIVMYGIRMEICGQCSEYVDNVSATFLGFVNVFRCACQLINFVWDFCTEIGISRLFFSD